MMAGTTETPPLRLSLRSYARRRGVSPTTVHRAVRDGRLSKSVTWVGGVPCINDAQLADQEWPATAHEFVHRGAVEKVGP